MRFNIYEKIYTPPILADRGNFLIKIAESPQEVAAAQSLRHKVFKLECGYRAENRDLYDYDEYDEYCLHLIVIEKSAGKVVGTYRIQAAEAARCGHGFYSAQEYHLDNLRHLLDNALEMGRSCVYAPYRNGTVMALLWSGIAEVLNRIKTRYMFGCVSLETTDSATGWAAYCYLNGKGYLAPEISVSPKSKFILRRPDENEIEKVLSEKGFKLIPPLMKGYLRLGARVCGEPVLDQEFGTIDFLILLDTHKIGKRYLRHFKVSSEAMVK